MAPCSVVGVDRRFICAYRVFAVIMAGVRTSETSAYFYETTQRHIAETCRLCLYLNLHMKVMLDTRLVPVAALSEVKALAWALRPSVRIWLKEWMCPSISVLSCVGRSLCDRLITRPKETDEVSKYD
jgi:hypothetical protein